jgi:hypothetical protein
MLLRLPFPLAVVIVSIALLPTIVAAQGRASGPGTQVAPQTSPSCPLGRDLGVLDGVGIRTFERITDTSPLIVETVVQSTAPGRAMTPNAPNGGPREIDVTLVATRALKGAAPASPFVVARLPARGFFDMQPQQHFIVFLSPLDDRAKAVYGTDLKNRFQLNMAATLCVDETNTVHVSTEGSFMGQFESLPLTKVTDEIVSYVKLPRVPGRIEIEGEAFPPQTMAVTLPNTVTAQSRLRVVATPSEPDTDLRLAIATYSPPQRSDAMATGVPGNAAPALPRNAIIDRTGAFELALATGIYRVTVEGVPLGYTLKALTFGGADVRREVIAVDPNANPDVIVTLAPASVGTTVSGRMTGIPPAADQRNMAVFLVPDEPAGAGPLTSPISADGTFRFQRVPQGRYTLTTRAALPIAIGSGGTPSSVRVLVGAQPVEQDVPIFAGAPATVAFAAGTAISGPNVLVRFRPTGGGNTITVQIRDAASLLWLPAGEYEVSLAGSGANLRIMSGDVDLTGKTLKSDGAKPLAPLVLTAP